MHILSFRKSCPEWQLTILEYRSEFGSGLGSHLNPQRSEERRPRFGDLLMEVRDAEPAEMRQVAELSRGLAADVLDPDPGADATSLSKYGFGADRWFECLVAVSETRVIGFACYCRIFEAHTRERRLWLGDLYVLPAARGKGVGGALVAALRKRADRLHCTGISLELARGNDVGRAFYAKVGAKPSDQIDVLRISTAR